MSNARAEPPSAVSIDYGAPAACPRAEGFAAELAARTPRTHFVSAGPHVRTLVVRIAAHRRRFGGRLVVREPTGGETERAVSANTCAEVVSALSLIAAVAIDPIAAAAAAGTAPTTASTEATAPPASAATADTPPIPDSARRVVASSPNDGGLDEGVPDVDDDADQPPPPRTGWAVALGAHAGVVRGVAPETLFLAPIFVDVAHETPALFQPAVRLRLERSGSGTVASGAASADFSWTAASLDFCPIAIEAGRFGARPCVRVEGGELAVRGVDVSPSRRGLGLWLAMGPVARGRVRIAGPLFVELEVAANVAFVRDRFFVEPGSTVFRAPLFGATATAGGGIGFW
jgi:hypothetical protein